MATNLRRILSQLGPSTGSCCFLNTMRKGAPAYSINAAFEEAFRSWEGVEGRPLDESEWRPIRTSQVKLRQDGQDGQGSNYQTITHSPAWTELRLRRRVRRSELPTAKGRKTLHWNLLSMAVSQIEPTLKPYDTYLPPLNSLRTQDGPLNSLDEVSKWMQLHRPHDNEDREYGNLEFLCTLDTPSPDRMRYLLQLCKEKKTSHLRRTLLESQDLLRMPLSFWKGAAHQTDRGGWWVRALSEELTASCSKCKRVWPAHQLANDGCTDCNASGPRQKVSSKKTSTKTHKTLGTVMRSALPEEIDKIIHQNLISDSTLTLPHIQSCLEDMMRVMGISMSDEQNEQSAQNPFLLWFTGPELGHPLVDDNHERPLHPLIGPFLRRRLSEFGDMDDDDDEMGHLHTGQGDTRTLALSMLEDWGTDSRTEAEEDRRTSMNRPQGRSRERFSTPHIARDPDKIEEVELESEDLLGMIRQPPKVGAVRFHHEPESIDTSHAGVAATTFQGITSIITPRGPYQVEGARWHLLTKVFSDEASFESDLHTELLLQERLDEKPQHRSFSWQVLRRAAEVFGAKTYVGESGFTTPPFFLNSGRGGRQAWGMMDVSPIIVNWSGLDAQEQAEITPLLASTDNWIILTHPLGPEKAITPPIPVGAKRILQTKGKASRERGWWKTGHDKLASCGIDTEVWISQGSSITRDDVLDLEDQLQANSEKDLPDMRKEGVESIYWAGTESGLMDIYNFPGVIYATDGSKSSKGMGAGFYRHDTKGGGCCRVGEGTGGGSSGRAEFAAACLALEDSLTHDQPIAVLTDSKGLMTVASNWVGEGKDPLLRHSPDGDILAQIIKVLQQRVDLGLFTIFIKIRAHRGEFLNEKADRWADEGRDDVRNERWGGPSSKPTFSWTEAGAVHRCSLNKTLRSRVHAKVAELQLPLHDNFTSEFLNRDDNSRDLLGNYWKDKAIPDRSKRRLMQSISHQFPCAKLLKLWGIRDDDGCRLCKRLHPEEAPWQESLGHIQARCPALQKPRIAVHHGIWRELLVSISRNSTEAHESGERKWYFPSAVSEVTHIEWTVRQILVHLGLFTGRRRFNEEIANFYAKMDITLTEDEITDFLSKRPDGVAFDAIGMLCVFLEFTRPMDSISASEEGDWAERKESEKNERYAMHRYFIQHLSTLYGRAWKCTQINFTVGARGSIRTAQFSERLQLLGVQDSRARGKIRATTVSKTRTLSDIILKLFHVSVLRSPEWALSSLSTELSNSQTSRYQLFTKFTSPFSGLIN